MVTKHYLPAFVRRDAEGREQAVCGTFITAADERLEALADSGCDTREEYEGLR